MSWIIAMAWLALLGSASGQRLAVLDLRDEAGLGERATTFLTDNVRGHTTDAVGKHLLVLSRENLQALLPPGKDLSECDGDCEVELARNIGADFVVSGGVVKIAGALRLSLQLHDTRSGQLMGRRTASARDLVGLERALLGTVSQLLQALAPSKAWLDIQGAPGLVVYVDGVRVGETPILNQEVTAGRHMVRLESPCREPYQEQLELLPKERRPIAVVPPLRTVPVEVRALGSDGRRIAADVLVDGAPVGRAGQPLNVSMCAQQLTVRTGDASWETKLELEGQPRAIFTATLATAPAPVERLDGAYDPTREAGSSLGGAAAVLIFSGGLLAAGGVGAGVWNRMDGEQLANDPGDQALRDRIETTYYVSRGLYIAGGSLAGLGLLLWIFADDGDGAVGLRAGPQGLGWAGRF